MTACVRDVTRDDVPALVALLDAAYGKNPSFEARLRTYLDVEPAGWVLIEDATGAVAVGGFVACGRCAGIGLMGVSPAAQRRGLGSSVLEALLRRCDERGLVLRMLDASAAGAPLYARFGFQDHGEALGFTFDTPPTPGLDVDRSLRIAAIDAQNPTTVEDVIALDARSFGAPRGPLLRRYLAAHPGRGLAARDPTGTLVGYVVAQARSVGPCAARSPEIAGALMRHALALPFEGAASCFVPGQNAAAVALVESLGGKRGRRWRHMRQGPAGTLESDWSTLFAKASLAVG